MENTAHTGKQFDAVIQSCREVFLAKMKDYGSSWRVLRVPSVTDQIYIKVLRIRSIDRKGRQMIEEGIRPEFAGIVNYSVIALIQLGMGDREELNLSPEEAEQLYARHVGTARDLMLNKNHDYDEAWREMRLSSLTDIILMKLMRIKQIEDHAGETLVSEGVESNYYDIINYSVFALIRIDEDENL
ncbi:MAG TPA: DUF1599 domain-containing protein [Bacteroidales bacterium]|nr:DUF1599 domain-containing protein [Bacteroidales bacterium]